MNKTAFLYVTLLLPALSILPGVGECRGAEPSKSGLPKRAEVHPASEAVPCLCIFTRAHSVSVVGKLAVAPYSTIVSPSTYRKIPGPEVRETQSWEHNCAYVVVPRDYAGPRLTVKVGNGRYEIPEKPQVAIKRFKQSLEDIEACFTPGRPWSDVVGEPAFRAKLRAASAAAKACEGWYTEEEATGRPYDYDDTLSRHISKVRWLTGPQFDGATASPAKWRAFKFREGLAAAVRRLSKIAESPKPLMYKPSIERRPEPVELALLAGNKILDRKVLNPNKSERTYEALK